MRTVGQPFPEFSSKSCVGPDRESLSEVNSGTIRGRWAVFVFYPKDFTFVCPTELADFNNKLREFEDRDAIVIGGSTDNEFSHLAWCQSHEKLSAMKYPLIAAEARWRSSASSTRSNVFASGPRSSLTPAALSSGPGFTIPARPEHRRGPARPRRPSVR